MAQRLQTKAFVEVPDYFVLDRRLPDGAVRLLLVWAVLGTKRGRTVSQLAMAANVTAEEACEHFELLRQYGYVEMAWGPEDKRVRVQPML